MNIQFSDIIDLSHTIRETMPHWPGDPVTQITRLNSVAQNGYNLNQLTIAEHSSTHFGAPSHFVQDGRSVDNMPLQRFIAPAIKIDVSAQQDPDYLLSVHDITQWEARFGEIPKNSVAIIQTGWSWFCETPNLYLFNQGKELHFPGISVQAAQVLVERHIKGLDIDTHGVDGGLSTSYDVNMLLAEHEIFHLENLTRLEKLKNRDVFLFIGVLPIERGNGSPCRVLALQ